MLLKAAGTKKTAVGVVTLLRLSIEEATRGMPEEIQRALTVRIPKFVDALVIDRSVRIEAKEFFRKDPEHALL